MNRTDYRDVKTMDAEEVLEVLRLYKAHDPSTAVKQHEIFTLLGGDPNDRNYAYLSYRTAELRDEGYPIKTSRRWGVWLEEA